MAPSISARNFFSVHAITDKPGSASRPISAPNDPEKQKQEQSGGVTVDNSAAEMHTTIYAIAESPKDPNLIWVGTDDGNVQVTRDGGKKWTNVVGNISGCQKNAWVSSVEAAISIGNCLRHLRCAHVRKICGHSCTGPQTLVKPGRRL